MAPFADAETEAGANPTGCLSLKTSARPVRIPNQLLTLLALAPVSPPGASLPDHQDRGRVTCSHAPCPRIAPISDVLTCQCPS